MAPIGSTNGSPAPTTGAASTSSNTTVNKNMFLQLLVAQLRNQDPMSPSDGTQFIGQLAQFQQLEQSVNSGQDISAIRTDLDALAAVNLQTAQATSQS
jgi:flagellar basal-body rod modification protein FlgD